VDRYVEIHHQPTPEPKTVVAEPVPVEARPRLKRYIND
jgi:putative transposase